MCKLRDTHLEVGWLPQRRSGYLGLLFAFGGSLLAVLGVGAWQTWENMPRQERAHPVVIDSRCDKTTKEPNAALPGRTVYHISGCHDQKEYWIIQIEPTTKGETDGQGKNRVRTDAGRKG